MDHRRTILGLYFGASLPDAAVRSLIRAASKAGAITCEWSGLGLRLRLGSFHRGELIRGVDGALISRYACLIIACCRSILDRCWGGVERAERVAGTGGGGEVILSSSSNDNSVNSR